MPQALISHSNVRGEDIAKLADSKIDIVLDPSNIHLADFSPLVRSFRNSKDDVRLSGTTSGTRHEMYLKSFLVDMGETMTLDAEVKATEIFDIDSLGIDANLKSITLTADVAKSVTAHFGPLTPEFTKVECSTEGVKLTWGNLAWATEYKIYRAPTKEFPTKELATVSSAAASEPRISLRRRGRM